MTGPDAARRLLASSLLRGLATAWTGGTLYLTGGALRDRLSGLPNPDLDLVADGDPRAAATALRRAFGGRIVPLGKPPLTTWRVVTRGAQFDVVALDGDLRREILRRDFTVNAVIWRLPRGPLVDLVGGLGDLAAGRIRTVREANLRSDPLRVLRGFRLAATRPLLRLTAETENQLAAAAPGLARVASERIVDELRLLLAGPACGRALAQAGRCGALGHVVPGWDASERSRSAAEHADRLSRLARSHRRWLAGGAAEILPAALAGPAAGFPQAWNEAAAVEALAQAGWAPRSARRLAAAASAGRLLGEALVAGGPPAREAAVAAGEHFPAALAWAVAAAAPSALALAAATQLQRWFRSFDRRPPLLDGSEVAAILRLPAGPARAAAVQALRLAQARGEARSSEQARRWLRGARFHQPLW